MALAASLAKALPKPKYTGEDETRTQQRGPRIVGPGELDESQIVLRVRHHELPLYWDSHTDRRPQRSGPPPYGQRAGWRPRSAADFGDGGAFPEVPVAQYPLDMGKASSTASNQLAVQVDAEGKVDYSALARQGHTADRVIHASFKDLIPLRNRANAGEISLERPSEEEVAATTERTKNALAALVSGAVAAQKPKNVSGGQRQEATFVRYTPANQGNNTKKGDRIMKIMERQKDPMEVSSPAQLAYGPQLMRRVHSLPNSNTRRSHGALRARLLRLCTRRRGSSLRRTRRHGEYHVSGPRVLTEDWLLTPCSSCQQLEKPKGLHSSAG